MSKNLYVDFHVLQTVPPSCVNRDDTGSPKTALYGGTVRSRVSSQSWKRAMRLKFEEEFEKEQLGFRTRNIDALVKKAIKDIDSSISEDDLDRITTIILAKGNIKAENKKAVLFFISALQIKALAEIAVKYLNDDINSLDKKSKEKKEKEYVEEIKNALRTNPSVDILLFGRMAASDTSLNYDAAAQVAHSISTHTVSNEYDYFTAVDDFKDDEDSGAGHLGTVEFNSSTLYRYATLNIGELYNKDKISIDEIKNIARGFTEAFVKSMPTGKQNTFANRTLPYLIYITVRDDQPINLVGAFERPIVSNENGFEESSERALFNKAQEIYEDYDMNPVSAWVVGKQEKYEVAKKVKYNEMIDDLVETIGDRLGKD
jgi:CRISPR system Cascade subunit CasC